MQEATTASRTELATHWRPCRPLIQQVDAQLSSLDVGLALRALGAVARRLADLPVAQLVVVLILGETTLTLRW